MSSIFGSLGSTSGQTSSLFGEINNPNQTSILGSSNTNNNTSQPGGLGSSLLGGLGNNASTSGGSGLFGSLTTSQPAQSGGIFGNLGLSKPPQPSSIFGTTLNTQPQQGTGLLGSLGQSTQTQQQSLLQLPGASIFGNLGQSTQEQQQQQPLQQQIGSIIGQSQSNRIWTEQDLQPRQKTVIDQIELVYNKWKPDSPNSLFQDYLYNYVGPDAAPFYRPGAGESEEKWEEALRKSNDPGLVPCLIQGFSHLGRRILNQEETLKILQGRLYEINDGLTDLLRRHDLDISTRAIECKRKHLVLGHKCLRLATKTQILRNRGYAMDGPEEELKRKLLELKNKVVDPALSGRSEEIWARMVNVRERGRLLQLEFEKAGRSMTDPQSQGLDEEVAKKAKKILEDYDRQLAHLEKEVQQISDEYTESIQTKRSADGYSRNR